MVKRLLLAALLLLAGCRQALPEPQAVTHYPDGVYRGTYYDYSTEQLAVVFEMKGQRFADIQILGMRYRDGNYLGADATQAQQAIVMQYRAAADYLLQKDVGALIDLYKKPEIIPDVDAVTGATLKTSAMVSAIYDGLSRMPYDWNQSKSFVFDTPVSNGSYRGFYYENGIERVAIAFALKDGVFTSFKLRALRDELGEDCRITGSAQRTISYCLDYLQDKPPSALAQLEDAVARVPRGDGLVADQLRSAIFGGISRGPYQSDDATLFFENLSVANGTYRGHYYDEGVEKMAVQFEVENGLLHNISLRREQENLSERTQLEKYRLACRLLEGKSVLAMNSVYRLSGDQFEAGELTYAISDALARGPYKLFDASLLPITQIVSDGTHGGSFQSGDLVIAVSLEMERNRIVSANLTGLKINADPFGEEAQAQQQLTEQLAKLSGKPLAQINTLYQWDNPLARPLIIALWDAVEPR